MNQSANLLIHNLPLLRTMQTAFIHQLKTCIKAAQAALMGRTSTATPEATQAQTQTDASPCNGPNSHTLNTTAWQVAWASTTGLRHLAQDKSCEDACCALPAQDGGCKVAVADGVSQGARGDVASAAAAQHCTQAPDYIGQPPEPYAQCVAAADTAVQTALQAFTQQRGATTLACAWLDAQGRGYINRVGDCRVYAWQINSTDNSQPALSVRALLPDQTYAQLGETPGPGIHPHNPARMVGINAVGQPDIVPIEVPFGAGLLLCSDGLHDVFSEADLGLALDPIRVQCPLQMLAEQLVQAAQARGSDDDVSVMLLQRIT